MANFLDDNFFSAFCDLFGVNKEDLEKIQNALKELEKPQEVNRMNPEGKSDEQLKAEGWVLEEDINESKDGFLHVSRTWRKGAGAPSVQHKDEKVNADKELDDQEIADINDLFNDLNSLLFHNWETTQEDGQSVKEFVQTVINSKVPKKHPKQILLDMDFLPANKYEFGNSLDNDISDHMEIVLDTTLDDFTEVFLNVSPKNQKWIVERLNKYVNLIQLEKEQIQSWSDGLSKQSNDPYFCILQLYLSLMYTYIDTLNGAVVAMIDYINEHVK